ncbi:putative short chain oxidoreductase/dehydrogenase [Durotheca rogersii]|uniref:putative short chain oxidoreductase/dehydrogenase n=1 Tax=Durotheca rogersii TaxID=419775 RepID=UPI002220FB71|nr:putative short chain oxidoreductase/dehydrogenase [Durotheca rogersii]KAI5867939.1 putative short chain oxidoreductase/dehydrogenase [Durotheca rogersii]
MAKAPVWLITGASRGLGLEIARAALKAGHFVVAGYRDKAKIQSAFTEIEALGGTWVQLDVAGGDVESQVQSVIAQHGQIDVLVNNAGYAILGSIEETSVEQIETIFRTNFVGPLRTIKAVLPSMRSRHSGTIVNISSSNAFSIAPGLGIYVATKFALEGVTEVLQTEISSFGIRTLLVEPGMTATDMLDPAGTGIKLPLTDAYRDTAVQRTEEALLIGTGERPPWSADPAHVAQRIVEAVDGTGILAGKPVGLRLPLGKDTGSALETRAAGYTALLGDMKEVWESV